MWEKCRFDCYLCYKFLWLDTGEYHLGEMFGTWHVFHSQLCHNSQVSHKEILVHTNFYFSPPHHLQMMFICLSSFCISTTFAIISQMCKNEMHHAFLDWWQEFCQEQIQTPLPILYTCCISFVPSLNNVWLWSFLLCKLHDRFHTHEFHNWKCGKFFMSVTQRAHFSPLVVFAVPK